MRFLVAMGLMLIAGGMITVSSWETTSYRTHQRLNRAAAVVLIVSGITFGTAISEAMS